MNTLYFREFLAKTSLKTLTKSKRGKLESSHMQLLEVEVL